MPTDQFYAQAQALNSTHPESHVNRIVQSFVDGHPEEDEFENPIIVKMKLAKNFINLLEWNTSYKMRMPKTANGEGINA